MADGRWQVAGGSNGSGEWGVERVARDCGVSRLARLDVQVVGLVLESNVM
jgi:hypothetical protein